MNSNRAITIKNQQLDVMTLGDALAKSGYFQDTKQAAQAVVKILAGQELGLGPIASMTGVNIIKGRVTLSANIMAAVIKGKGHYNYRVKKLDNDECIIEFFENSQSVGVSQFSMQDAQTAGLTGQENWRKYPRNMMFARALSNGAKWYCPDAFSGATIYTPDELGAEIDGETGEMITSSGPVYEAFEDSPDLTEQDEIVQRELQERQSKGANGNGTATIASGFNFKGHADQLAQAIVYYADSKGNPNMYHILGAAKKCGYSTISADNADDVIAAISERYREEYGEKEAA